MSEILSGRPQNAFAATNTVSEEHGLEFEISHGSYFSGNTCPSIEAAAIMGR
jgi:hypothetical protein